LREDGAWDDLTSRSILARALPIRARIVAKASGVLAGVQVAAWTFGIFDSRLRCILRKRDGAHISPGQTILTVEGKARSIFAAERTALNYLGHLSGIATLTAAFVRRVKATRAKIFDTRKTLPNLRMLEKYAVRLGGGHNHRMDLSAAILIKTNHVLAYSVQRVAYRETIQGMIRQAKRKARGKLVEIEVRNLKEFEAALRAQPDIVLLDNWSADDIRKAVRLRNLSPITHHLSPLLEVSGGITLNNVRAIAKTGVERISIGCLTHSAPSLDLSLEVLVSK
jgi:nicotinate-nucleotide pyrophosphorylase (carboxylating)